MRRKEDGEDVTREKKIWREGEEKRKKCEKERM